MVGGRMMTTDVEDIESSVGSCLDCAGWGPLGSCGSLWGSGWNSCLTGGQGLWTRTSLGMG